MDKVEFTVTVSHLRSALQILGVNRGGNTLTDFVDLLVSEYTAKLHSVGTTTEIPVNGMSPGTARMPLELFRKAGKILGTFQKTELTIKIEAGALKIASWSAKSEEITVGTIPDQKIDLAVDASVLDTLAIAHLLTPKQIEEQGLSKRVERARRVLAAAIGNAVHALSCVEAAPQQIEAIAKAQIKAAAARLEKSLAARQG